MYLSIQHPATKHSSLPQVKLQNSRVSPRCSHVHRPEQLSSTHRRSLRRQGPLLGRRGQNQHEGGLRPPAGQAVQRRPLGRKLRVRIACAGLFFDRPTDCTFSPFQEQTRSNKACVMRAVAALTAACFPSAPSATPRVFLQVPLWRRQAAPVALELPAYAVDAGILGGADQGRTLPSAMPQHKPYKVLLLSLHVSAPRC